ncbi:hypothetical protein EV182_008131, partial [Spiromyces aspiralis]
MNELRTQVQEFLQHAANQNESYRKSLIALINNYDLIVNVLQEHGFTDHDDDPAYWKQLLSETVYGFAEEQLTARFSYLKDYVVTFEVKSDVREVDP